ncbi:MAG: pyruvate, phosphate dikinase [Ignavibacteria bacterium]|jgi:pyruvate,orthophosphate dikinase|nr:pyruvate, phosphate dikinase [Ignavibacteria bacterium]
MAKATTTPKSAPAKPAAKSPSKTPSKFVYYFGGGKAEGGVEMKNLLGGKGANLAEMVNLGIPVPTGFTITTEVCTHFYANNNKYPQVLEKQVNDAIAKLERETKKKFGDPQNPLLVSVRSGARASMPGMMDTILNLGLNDKTVESLAKKTNNPRFAYDSYRRLLAMYGDVVLGLKPETKEDEDPFELIIEDMKRELGIKQDTEFKAENLKELARRFKEVIRKKTRKAFPQDPKEQLWGAINAVFSSWMNERAIIYRKMNGIPESWGTAVNVQSMVFGNMGETSGTGVAFTRDPATGDNDFYGEFLMNAQGEDVVAGTRTPGKIKDLADKNPEVYKQLIDIRAKLEKHYKDMNDIEFTIEEGKLWMLQCRVGKRTAYAAMKMAVDMVAERLITPDVAITRIEPATITQLLRPVFDLAEKKKTLANGGLLAQGLNAGPGAATGKVVFNAEDAAAWKEKGEKVILVRIETSPEDIKGMDASEGILTARGGMTSHAALVARQMGKVCVAGCGALNIDYKSKQIKIDGIKQAVREGDYISLDGDTGEVIRGEIKTMASEVVQMLIDKKSVNPNSETIRIYNQIMDWADAFRTLQIRTNADQPDQAANAVAFGAEGIGLCRTEHMFFGAGKIEPMREMILAKTVDDRKKALNKLLPLQRKDFEGIFEAMNGRPVTIRTIDPPLHEFLPHEEKEQSELAQKMGLTLNKVKERVSELKEANPMLGFRGCRLGLIYPEITEMQARAIFEATVNVLRKKIKVLPEIMIPLVGNVKELKSQEEIVRRVAAEVMKEKKIQFKYNVGTMIEVPRGAITAGKIAEVAEFFSFGTNDLTQTSMGLSRDDAGRFLPEYVKRDIYDVDPFVAIDREGVGFLMQHAVVAGKKTRPDIHLGICGEHGGDPSSIEFCHNIGLHYVSCSPFRVPVAKVAAAKAAIDDKSNANRIRIAEIKRKLAAAKAAPAKALPAKPAPKKSVPAKAVPSKVAPKKPAPSKAAPAKKPIPAKPAPSPAKKPVMKNKK